MKLVCINYIAIINLIAMAAYLSLLAWLHLSLMATVAMGVTAEKLSPDFYDKVCPKALPTIKTVVEQAIAREPRMGASLLRLHFHDCFVNGCDASVLLDDTPNFTGEKSAGPNKKSARGFEVVDQIKAAVNSACDGNVVSCADILAVAARDSVVASGGHSYKVLLGRRDSTTASKAAANKNIPSPFLDFSGLFSNFQSHGLTLEDLVVLSGAHTIGVARCKNFRSRIHNDTNIDSEFAASLHPSCPVTEEDDSISSLDGSPARFDTGYFNNLLQKKGLLHSDQELYKGDGGASDGLVKFYSGSSEGFWIDFGVSMIKMGNLSPLTGSQGEIRMDCRKVN